jgi:hypothetical protein
LEGSRYLYPSCLSSNVSFAHIFTGKQKKSEHSIDKEKARQRFGIAARQVHVDTTSFAVSGEAEQLRRADEGAHTETQTPIFVADSGLYSADNIARLGAAGVHWISRVPDTSTVAHAALDVADDAWQQGPLGPAGTRWWAPVAQPPEGERWLVVRTAQGEERVRTTLARKVAQANRWGPAQDVS